MNVTYIGAPDVLLVVQHGVRPNVRTYTALITAMCNAKQWDRALETLHRMKTSQSLGHVEPNAYTYSAILKTMGEHVRHLLAPLLMEEFLGPHRTHTRTWCLAGC